MSGHTYAKKSGTAENFRLFAAAGDVFLFGKIGKRLIRHVFINADGKVLSRAKQQAMG